MTAATEPAANTATRSLRQPLMVQLSTPRTRITPVLWLESLGDEQGTLALGDMPRPRWLKAGRSVTLDIVNPSNGELLCVNAELRDGHSASDITFSLASLTAGERTSLRQLADIAESAAPRAAATPPPLPRRKRANRAISGTQLRETRGLASKDASPKRLRAVG